MMVWSKRIERELRQTCEIIFILTCNMRINYEPDLLTNHFILFELSLRVNCCEEISKRFYLL